MTHLHNKTNKTPDDFRGYKEKQSDLNPMTSMTKFINDADNKKEELISASEAKTPTLLKDVKVLAYLSAILLSFGMMSYSCLQGKVVSKAAPSHELKLKTQKNERIKE